MEKCNTYNTENLPPATSLAYFGIKSLAVSGMWNSQTAYLKACNPGIFHIIDADIPVYSNPIRQIIDIPKRTGLADIPMCEHVLFSFIGKSYRYLQTRRGTSTGDCFDGKYDVVESALIHIGNSIVVQVYHMFNSFHNLIILQHQL